MILWLRPSRAAPALPNAGTTLATPVSGASVRTRCRTSVMAAIGMEQSWPAVWRGVGQGGRRGAALLSYPPHPHNQVKAHRLSKIPAQTPGQLQHHSWGAASMMVHTW